MADQTVTIAPPLKYLSETLQKRCTGIQAEIEAHGEAFIDSAIIERLRISFLAPLEKPSPKELAEELPLITTLSVIIDLITQGWRIERSCPDIVLSFTAGASAQEEKARIRRAHMIERDSQVREVSVLAFIKSMEKRRLTPNGWHSIFSVMRDGRELAPKLEAVLALEGETERLAALRTVVEPYIQFVDSEAVCEHTGLRLNDIWRYFRHTWVNSYKSVPGRSMNILIRDAAARNHPVIGIAALGSAVVQQAMRDRWIGWESGRVLDRLRGLSAKKLTVVLLGHLETLTRGIYTKDLLNEGVVSMSELKKPTEEVISKLFKESDRAIRQHRIYPHAAKHKQTENLSRKAWQERAETSLFRSKRSRILATLLSIRKTFVECSVSSETPNAVQQAFEIGRFRTAVGQLFRMVKAERVGINMMDIMVCGAVAPYNLLIGGKLICFLLCSPEVVKHYATRYGDQTSVIASAMKGAEVKRPAQLVLLCTTSLYGSALSQYSRVKIPAATAGGVGEKVEFENLGLSEGFGVFHFSRETLRLMNMLLGRSKESRKVNSIFGEGVNPLMRKLREGLSMLGLPADVLLRHGNKRVVYGVSLARNFREVLLGFSARPQYLIPHTKVALRSEELAEYWRRRWLVKRLEKPGLLEEVVSHSLVYPIRHGAQVQLPVDVDAPPSLWE